MRTYSCSRGGNSVLSSVMYEINVSTFEEWREHARELLKRDVHPTTIVWVNGNQQVLSFCEDSYLEIPTSTHFNFFA